MSNKKISSETQNQPESRRFIPFRKRDIIGMCLSGGAWPEQEQAHFRDFCRQLQSIFHFELHQLLENLKDSYSPINPDADTRPVNLPDKVDNEVSFAALLTQLMQRANYETISHADVELALQQASLFNIRLLVNFNDYSEVLLFCRGESVRHEAIPTWFGLRKRQAEFTNYERVVIYVKFRNDFQIAGNENYSFRAGATLLKLFQNVPKADLEMLFPNTRIRMRNIDKLLIGIPAVVSGGIVLTTKLGATLVLLGSLLGFWIGVHSVPVVLDKAALVALFIGLATVGSYLWKQISNFKNRKLKFMQKLTENLYFKNLDNNAGVFHRLIDDAEEEECKEAILAYFFLLRSDQPLSSNELDQTIEEWFRTRWQIELNFEVDDAISKLDRLGLVTQTNGNLSALPLAEANDILGKRWNDYLQGTAISGYISTNAPVKISQHRKRKPEYE